jgi:putative transposase
VGHEVRDEVVDFVREWSERTELAAAMKESDVELVLQRAKEKYPEARPRIITDNGPQFIARDFHEFIRMSGMTHVRTSPYYPQSNGKKERWYGSFKVEGWRPGLAEDEASARQLIGRYVDRYNGERLHSAIGYVTPADKLAGREAEIFAARDRKLETARNRRAEERAAAQSEIQVPA